MQVLLSLPPPMLGILRFLVAPVLWLMLEVLMVDSLLVTAFAVAGGVESIRTPNGDFFPPFTLAEWFSLLAFGVMLLKMVHPALYTLRAFRFRLRIQHERVKAGVPYHPPIRRGAYPPQR